MLDYNEVSIIFLKKTVDDSSNSMKFREKKDMCWSIFCVRLKFQGDSRFLHKFPGYFQGSSSQNIFLDFQGFQGAVGTLFVVHF